MNEVPLLHQLSVDDVKSRIEAGEKEVLIGCVSTELEAAGGNETAVEFAMAKAARALQDAGLVLTSGAYGRYDDIIAMVKP